VLYRLEAEEFECVLADAKQVKNLPGRPERDPSDSRWLAQCFERGAVTGCFVATPEFRIIRERTRYRRDLTGERTREKQRAEKLLESAAVKLSCVVTDLHGVTGRDVMDHLIAGERNPKVLAQLARGRARRKIAELEHALEGAEFFTPQLAALLATMLARIDQLNVSIDELSAVIETLLEPYEEQLQQAGSMPGWGRRPAQDAIAETGVDMSRFRTGAHLASWAGKTPLDHQSGSRGVALGNTQMKVYHKLLSTPGMRYEDLGADYYDNRASTRRQIRALEKRARELGYALVPDLTGCPEAS
jgi:transposase